MNISQRSATLIGTTSILQWGSQVLLSVYAIAFPSFQLIGMTFFIAFMLMFAKWCWNRESFLAYARYPLRVWAIGISGLFGYYAIFYLALKLAPPVEVTLLVNLWPLLMVLFTAFLPNQSLRWNHVLGCLLGAAGSTFLVGPEALTVLNPTHLTGQVLAIAAAIIWAGFCVGSRAIDTVPTDTVGWYCLMTSVLALVCHVVFEPTITAVSMEAWLAVLALGIGPIGLAFFAWDIGIKRGDIQLLGVLAFFIPMISALLIIAAGKGHLDLRVGMAALLITGGALTAAKDEVSNFARRKRINASETTVAPY